MFINNPKYTNLDTVIIFINLNILFSRLVNRYSVGGTVCCGPEKLNVF